MTDERADDAHGVISVGRGWRRDSIMILLHSPSPSVQKCVGCHAMFMHACPTTNSLMWLPSIALGRCTWCRQGSFLLFLFSETWKRRKKMCVLGFLRIGRVGSSPVSLFLSCSSISFDYFWQALV